MYLRSTLFLIVIFGIIYVIIETFGILVVLFFVGGFIISFKKSGFKN